MQDFRFCLRCQRVALIECEKCIFCKGGFLMERKKATNEYMKKWYNKQKNKV